MTIVQPYSLLHFDVETRAAQGWIASLHPPQVAPGRDKTSRKGKTFLLMRTTASGLVHTVRRIHRLGIWVKNERSKIKVQHPKKNLLSYSERFAGPHNPVEEKKTKQNKTNPKKQKKDAKEADEE